GVAGASLDVQDARGVAGTDRANQVLRLANQRVELPPFRAGRANLAESQQAPETGIVSSPLPVLDGAFRGVHQARQSLLAHVQPAANATNDLSGIEGRHVF